MMSKYKEQALEGMTKVVDQVKPQALAEDDDRVVELCEELQEAVEDEDAMRCVNLGRELKDIAEVRGYAVNMDE